MDPGDKHILKFSLFRFKLFSSKPLDVTSMMVHRVSNPCETNNNLWLQTFD